MQATTAFVLAFSVLIKFTKMKMGFWFGTFLLISNDYASEIGCKTPKKHALYKQIEQSNRLKTKT